MKVIATIAERGAGKGLFVKTARKLYPRLKIETARFSDPLRKILEILNKEESRENLQTLATALRNGFGDEGILNGTLKKIADESDADVLILDGARKKEETEFVKKMGGILIYITADPKARFDRRRTDAENIDEREMTWEKFLELEKGKTEITIRQTGETMADFKIENNGTVEEFEEKIKKILDEIL